MDIVKIITLIIALLILAKIDYDFGKLIGDEITREKDE